MKKIVKTSIAIVLCFMMLLGSAAVGSNEFAGLTDALTLSSSADGYSSIGGGFEYGYFPQSRVTDEELIEVLNDIDCEWVSYPFSDGTRDDTNAELILSEHMWYKDVSYNGEKYRAVTFDKYRVRNVGEISSEGNSYQDENGYYINNIYWFKYDPIQWVIIDPESGFVICANAIDAGAMNNTECWAYTDSAKTAKFNDYKESYIRQWLNNDFYNIAFTEEQKENIKTTALENGMEDKVFLLSLDDQYTQVNGHKYFGKSEYSKCRGLCINTGNADRFHTLLRTTGNGDTYVCAIHSFGMWVNTFSSITNCFGIVPGMHLTTIKDDTGKEFKVTYNANGGADAPDSQIKEIGTNLTLSENIPTIENGKFMGWNTRINGTGTSYKPGDVISDDMMLTLYAQWHIHDYASETAPATCTTDGTTVYTCECGDTYSETITATGHKYVDHDAKAPTCTEIGWEAYQTCSNPGCDYSTCVEIPATGHKFQWVYNNDASTDSDGTETQVCSVCGQKGETRTAEGTRQNKNVVINFAETSSYDYRTRITVLVTATGIDEGYHLELTANGHTYTGSREEVKSDEFELESNTDYTVKVVKDNTGAEQTVFTKQGKINCNKNIFKIIIAFFKGLFGILPSETVKK